MARYQSYIICTSPRSGSTLLCKLLAATGVAGKPGSYFHNPSISEWLNDYDLHPKSNATDREVLNLIFDEVRQLGTADTGMFGLRVQRGSFDFLIRQLALLHPDCSSDVERFHAAFGNTLFIHLSRANKLEQAVSFVKATQTGLWHQAPDGTELERLSAPQEPAYDRELIARHLSELSALDDQWAAWFADADAAQLKITYEDLSADPGAVLRDVLEALGLDAAAADGVGPGVAKLADETSRAWIERFQADT